MPTLEDTYVPERVLTQRRLGHVAWLLKKLGWDSADPEYHVEFARLFHRLGHPKSRKGGREVLRSWAEAEERNRAWWLISNIEKGENKANE